MIQPGWNLPVKASVDDFFQIFSLFLLFLLPLLWKCTVLGPLEKEKCGGMGVLWGSKWFVAPCRGLLV